MTKLLLKLIKTDNRNSCARLSGITGIICNLILCAVKFFVGTVTGSVSVTADAVNNLSDSASNIVTLTGAKLSDKPDDREHPFGHGRIEYVSALIVAVSIFVVGFELAKTSVEKIITPQEMKFSIASVIILAATIAVKLWMAYFNHRLYKISDNLNLKAVRQDSVNDCIATTATVLSLVLSHIFEIKRIDGIIGLCVSLFILYSGADLLRQVISPLLGETPSKEITDRIEEIITESDIVLGVHDLVIHSYGANKMLASADAEVDARANIFTIHDAIDAAEKKVRDELNITICIHMDPIDKTDSETERYKLITQGIIRDYNADYSFHDFRLTDDGGKAISFELQVPFEDNENTDKIKEEISERLTRLCPEVSLDIDVEHSYV